MSGASKAVFLSYASQDAEAARRICEALRAAGVEVWFDQSELRGGDAWDRQIKRQIHDCALFLPIISITTQGRLEGYFRREWRLAVDRTRDMADGRPFLVPIVIDATQDSDAEVPDSFRAVQWSRLPGGETPPAFVERISRLVSTYRPASTERAPSIPARFATSELPAPKGTATPHPKWAALLIALAVILIGGYVALDRWVLSKRPVPAATAMTAAAVPESGTIPQKSIAVLPFVNMSSDKDQEYFSDGLSEELIEQLSKIPDLRVPARSSSFYFKDKPEDIATMAQKLRVAHVLEGSVRKSGNRLRVTAELIRADNGYQLWSETYDRELKDVFQVQDDIAGAVVGALKLKLGTVQAVASQRTTNTDAYNEFLLGRQFAARGGVDGFQRALENFKKAIALDPNYAAAYADLAVVEYRVADLTADAAGAQQARATGDKAIALAPDAADGYAVRGFIRSNLDWDWVGAQADFARALKQDPSNSTVQRRYAQLLGTLGRLPEAIAADRKVVEVDPLSQGGWENLSRFLASNGELAAAHEAL